MPTVEARKLLAAHLNISEKTVRNHTSNLFEKLSVVSRAQAIVFARDRGSGGDGRRRVFV